MRIARLPSKLALPGLPRALVASAWVLLCLHVVSADDWPQLQRDSLRSGSSAETGVTNPLSAAWTADTPSGSGIVSSPVVADGYVLVGSIDGYLRCYDESSGLLLWSWKANEPIASTPLVDRGHVYAVDRVGTLACLDLASGTVEWSRSVGGQGFSSPTTSGGSLFFGTGFPKKTVSSFDKFTGAGVWDKQLTQPSFASPATDGASVWSISNDGKLFRADAVNGTEIWLDSTQGSPQGIPILVGAGALYLAPGGYDTSLYRVDAASGMPAWIPPLLFAGDPATQSQATCPEAGAFSTQVVPNWRYVSSGALRVPGGIVCVEGGITNLRLFGLDEASGAILWSLDAGAPDAGLPFASSPSYASGRVFVGGAGAGALVVVDPSGAGSIVQTIAMPGAVASSPAIANARVFAASSGGRLAAFDSAGNRAPGVVSGMTPTGVGTGPAVTASWTAATDSGPGADPSSALRYLVRWDDDGEVLKDFDGEALTPAGTTSQLLSAYAEDKVVTWRVRTLDTQGAWSGWSPAATFVVYDPWRVQGRVTRGGVGLAGVTVTMTGSGSGTTLTDANGYYNFFGVPDGVYTLAFSRAGYSFAPTSIGTTVSGGHQLGLDTTATLLAIYAIRGRVVFGATGVPGVTVDLTGGSTGTTTTDASGNYAFTGLTNGNYTATPLSYGLAFAPPARSTTISGADVTGQDFVATRTGSAEEEAVVGLGSTGQGFLYTRGGYSSGYVPIRTTQIPWGPYDAAVGAGHPALGDVDGDGLDEVVVGLGSYPRVGGWLAIFDDSVHGHAVLRWYRLSWAAYNAANGETWPACGNFDADARAEIVLGIGTYPANGGWLLLIDDLTAGLATRQWMRAGQLTYLSTNGATYPAAGDLNGDGVDEVVVGFGTGGQGLLSVLHASDGFRVQRFLRVPWNVYDAGTGATRPACGNLDGDARKEVVVGLQGTASLGWWGCFDDETAGSPWIAWRRLPWTAYDTAVGTTRPACGDLDGDGRDEVLLGLGPYPTDGGYLYTYDDFSAGLGVLGPWNLGTPAYNARNGESWPACGDTR